MVEGKNDARGQWIGRTSQNKTLNFTAPEACSPESAATFLCVTTELSE